MKKLVAFLGLGALLCLAACNPEISSNDPKKFTVSPASSNISAYSQTLEYTVDCDKSWTVNMGKSTWAKITEADINNGKVSVSAAMNDTPDVRTDTLYVKSGTKSLKVPIVQNSFSTILSSSDVTLVGTVAQTITIHANGPWSAELTNTLDSSWLTMEPKSGKVGDTTITLQANDENVNVGDRNLIIRFTMGSDKFTATVTQKQKDALLKDKDKVELSNGAQNFDLTLQTNVNYSVSIDCDWIERVDTKGLNTMKESFYVHANPDMETREADITFTGGDVVETVHVFQAECDVLIIGGQGFGDTYTVGPEGGKQEVELKSNIEYEIIWPDADWLGPVQPSLGISPCTIRSDVLAFTVQPNLGLAERSATIVVKDKNSAMSASLNVRQMETVPEFINSDVYGAYDKNGEAIFAYTPFIDQIAVFKGAKDNSFRIQNAPTGTYFLIEGIPADITDKFGISIRHNMDVPIVSSSRYEVVVAKTENRKVWLYSEDGTGFIIKK